MLSIELTNDNPWRPADWRWQRAALLARGEIRPNRHFDDSRVRQLERFARIVLDEDSPELSERLALQERSLFWAYQLYSQDEPGRRAELEARIIANQEVAVIATKTGLTERLVQAYEWAFYDVRDKLIAPSYVLHTLLGTALHRGMQERDYPLIWKYLAYTYGTCVMEAYMQQATKPSKPRDASGVQGCLVDAGFMAVLRKQMLAGTIVPLNQFTQTQILDIYAKFVEIDKVSGTGTSAAGQSTLITNVQAILNLIPLDIGPYSKVTVDGPVMARYDSSSEEMPTVRLLMAAQRQVPEDEEPDNLEYPEPSNHVRTANNDAGSDDAGAGSSNGSGGGGAAPNRGPDQGGG